MMRYAPLFALLACTGDDPPDTGDTDSGAATTCEDSVLSHVDWVQTYTYGEDGRPIAYGEDVDQDGVPNTAIDYAWSGDTVVASLSYDGEPWWVDTITFDGDLPIALDHEDGGDSWVTEWTWDDGHMTSRNDVDGWQRSWAYDEDGHVVEYSEAFEDYVRVITWTWEDGAPVLSEVDQGDDGTVDEVVRRTWTFDGDDPVAADLDEGDDGSVDSSFTFFWNSGNLVATAWSTADEGLCTERGYTYDSDDRVLTVTTSYSCGEEPGTDFVEYTYGCEGTAYARPSPFPDFWEENLGEALDLARRAEPF